MASCSTSSPLQEPGFAPTIPVLEPAVDDTGRLEGQVLFEGSEIPAPTLVANTTDPQHCGKVHSLEDVLVEREGRGIQNVILALKDVILPEGYSVEPGRLLLDNRNCRFMPHAAVLTTGSVLEATNSDPISHSVHLYGFRNINLALGPKSSKTVRVLQRPGMFVIKCDVHGWMQAFLRVDDHPFHAVTAADGTFQIDGLPRGFHRLELWHEHFGQKEVSVEVKAQQSSHVTISYGGEN